MIFGLGILLIFTLNVEEARSKETIPPVNVVIWPQWMEGMINYHLTKMTAELYRDAATKMKTVKKNAEMHQKNNMYAIGAMASSIYALFDKMIKIYQDIADLHKTRNRPWDHLVEDSLMAFGICQSLYHKIRLDKKLFQELQKKQSADMKEQKEAFLESHGKQLPPGFQLPLMPRGPIGGMNVDRRSNIDDLFDENDFDRNFELPFLSKLTTKKVNIIQQRAGKTVDKRIKTATSRRPFAPPPKKPSDYLEKSKKFELQIPQDISKILPPDFNKKPPNPGVAKLMSQLNKDNPHLNPDLDAYLRPNHRHKRPKSDAFDNEDLPIPRSNDFSFQSRRSGSNPKPKMQSPKSKSSSNSPTSKTKPTKSHNADYESSDDDDSVKFPIKSEKKPKEPKKKENSYYGDTLLEESYKQPPKVFKTQLDPPLKVDNRFYEDRLIKEINNRMRPPRSESYSNSQWNMDNIYYKDEPSIINNRVNKSKPSRRSGQLPKIEGSYAEKRQTKEFHKARPERRIFLNPRWTMDNIYNEDLLMESKSFKSSQRSHRTNNPWNMKQEDQKIEESVHQDQTPKMSKKKHRNKQPKLEFEGSPFKLRLNPDDSDSFLSESRPIFRERWKKKNSQPRRWEPNI